MNAANTMPTLESAGEPAARRITIRRADAGWERQLDTLRLEPNPHLLLWANGDRDLGEAGAVPADSGIQRVIYASCLAAVPYGQWDALEIRCVAPVLASPRWTLTYSIGNLVVSRGSRQSVTVVAPSSDFARLVDVFRAEEEHVEVPSVPMDAVIKALLGLPPMIVEALAAIDATWLARRTLIMLSETQGYRSEVWAALAPLAEDIEDLDQLEAAFVNTCSELGVDRTVQLAEVVMRLMRGTYRENPSGYRIERFVPLALEHLGDEIGPDRQ